MTKRAKEILERTGAQDEYPPIEQACIVLSSSKDKETAREFLSFVKTAAATEILKRYGFDVDTSS